MTTMKLRGVYELNTASVKNSKIEAIRIEIFKNIDSQRKYSARIYFLELTELNIFLGEETPTSSREPLWVDKTYLWQGKWNQFSSLNSKKAAKIVIKDVQSFVKTLVKV